jgi:hypothetical protein
MTRYYAKPKRRLDDLEMRKRVNIFREALSEVPELHKIFMEFHSILSNFWSIQDHKMDRSQVSEFYADAVLAAMVQQKLLKFK